MSYGLAGMLLLCGLIGLLFSWAVGDRVGLGTAPTVKWPVPAATIAAPSAA